MQSGHSGCKICKEAVLQSKISPVVAVHAADHEYCAKGLRSSRALLGFFDSMKRAFRPIRLECPLL